MDLFSIHLNLLGIEHKKADLPTIRFDAMDSETPLNVMQRVTMGYDAGILTLNQALDILNLPEATEGDERKDVTPVNTTPEGVDTELPRENSQPGAEENIE
jgi:hypothetical protein